MTMSIWPNAQAYCRTVCPVCRETYKTHSLHYTSTVIYIMYPHQQQKLEGGGRVAREWFNPYSTIYGTMSTWLKKGHHQSVYSLHHHRHSLHSDPSTADQSGLSDLPVGHTQTVVPTLGDIITSYMHTY